MVALASAIRSCVFTGTDALNERHVTALFSYAGLEQVEIKEAAAGDIVGLTGCEDVYIGETLTDSEEREPLQFVDIDPPTIRMHILVNDSPFAGREGKFVTARHVRERLIRETQGNVSLQVNDTETAGAFEINARGEMQIAILVEQMRREGYELMISRPEVILRRTDAGALLEPIENLYVDLPNENLGDVLQSIANRKGEILAIHHHASRVSVEAIVPTRGLIGFETDFVNQTRGEGLMSHLFREYAPFKGDMGGRGRGVMVSMEPGRQHCLRTQQHSGARPSFHWSTGRRLRRHDRWRKQASRRFASQSMQGKALNEHAQPGRRQGHST